MAKKSWETVFEFGGKIAGSLNSAVGGIQKKFQGLAKTAKTVTGVLGKIGAGLAIGAVAAGIGLVGKTLFGVFAGAETNARNAIKREQELTAILNANVKIRQRGVNAAANDVAVLSRTAAALEQVGVIGDDHYMAMAKTLALYGQSPAKINQMLGPLGDVLVATKGVNASQGEAESLANAIGTAIQRGQLRSMQQYGVAIDEATQKRFREMKPAQRLNYLMQQLEGYQGANLLARDTDLGAIQVYENQLASFSKNVGNMMIPMNAEFARLGSELLPALQPIVETVFGAFTSSMRGATEWARENLAPFFRDFSANLQENLGPALGRLGEAFGRVGDAVGRFFGVTSEGSKSMGDIVSDAVIGAIEKLAGALEWAADNMDIIAPIVITITAAFVGLQVALAALSIGALLTNPVGLAIIAVAALAAGVYWVIKNWGQVGDAVQGAYDEVMRIIGPWVQAIEDDFQRSLDAVKTAWNSISQVFTDIGTNIVSALQGAYNRITGIWDGIGSWFETTIQPIVAVFTTAFTNAYNQATSAWANLSQWFNETLTAVQTQFNNILQPIVTVFQNARNEAQAVWDGLAGWFETSVVQPITQAFSGISAMLQSAFTQPIEAIKGAWDGLRTFIWNAITNMIPDWARRWVPGLGSGGGDAPAPATQFGGIFSSPQVRSIAEAGTEAVIPMNRTSRARGLLDKTAGAMGFDLASAASGLGQKGQASNSYQGGAVSMSYAPQIVVNGPMDSAGRTALGDMLSEHASNLLSQLEAAQNQERRLAFS